MRPLFGRKWDGLCRLCCELSWVQDSLRTLWVWARFMQNRCCLLLRLMNLFRQCSGNFFLQSLGTNIVLYLRFPVERSEDNAIVWVMGVLLPRVWLLRLVTRSLSDLRELLSVISVVSDLYLLCRVRFSGGAGEQLIGLRVVVIWLVMLILFGRPVVICSKDMVCPILGCRTKWVALCMAQGTFVVRNLCLKWVAVEPTCMRTVTRLVDILPSKLWTCLIIVVVLLRLALKMSAWIALGALCREDRASCLWVLFRVSMAPVRLTTDWV